MSVRVLPGMAGERRARLAGIARTATPASRKALQRRISYLMIVAICFGLEYSCRDQV